MKKTLLILSLILMMVTSCKKESQENEEQISTLLSTVPAKASGVVVINLEEILKDADYKIENNKLVPGPEVKSIIENLPSYYQEYISNLPENSGIDLKEMVAFFDSGRFYLTFLLNNENAFIKFVEEITQKEFTKESNGVKMTRDIAVKGSQAWVCLSDNRRVDPELIASYKSLKNEESFESTSMGKKMMNGDNNIIGWMNIGKASEEIMNRQERAQAMLLAGLVFEDPEAVEFTGNLKKGRMETKVTVINSEGQPAKCVLPFEQVDVSTLKKLGSSCDFIGAFTITPALVNKFSRMMESFSGFMGFDINSVLQNINGTIGLAGNIRNETIAGIITTNGELDQDQIGILKSFNDFGMISINQDGNYLEVSNGLLYGDLGIDECTKALQGCWMGFVLSPQVIASSDPYVAIPEEIDYIVFKLQPKSGSAEWVFEIKSENPNENILITLLKSMF